MSKLKTTNGWYPDLGGASGWICEANFQPIRNTTQIRGMTRHQYGISALVSQTSFRRQITSGVEKCRLFYRAGKKVDLLSEAKS